LSTPYTPGSSSYGDDIEAQDSIRMAMATIAQNVFIVIPAV
jgi:hypothetical protein